MAKQKSNQKSGTKKNIEDSPQVESKRTSYEIFAKMLQICQKPQNKTRIMYKTNTSYTSFKKYLQQLQEMKLLQQEAHTKNIFKTTQRGFTFLEKYDDLKQFLNENNSQKYEQISS